PAATICNFAGPEDGGHFDHIRLRCGRWPVRSYALHRRDVWRCSRLRTSPHFSGSRPAARVVRLAGDDRNVRIDCEGLLERLAHDRRHERLLPPTAAPRRYRRRPGFFPRVGDARSIHFWTDPRPGKRLPSSTHPFEGIDPEQTLGAIRFF